MEEDADSRRWAELAGGLSSGDNDGETTGDICPTSTPLTTLIPGCCLHRGADPYSLAHGLSNRLKVKA